MKGIARMPKPFRIPHHVHTHIHLAFLSLTPGKHSGKNGKATQASLYCISRNHAQLSHIGNPRKNENSGNNGNILRLPQNAGLPVHSGNIGKKDGNNGKGGNTISSSPVRNSRRHAPNHNGPGNIPATSPAKRRLCTAPANRAQCSPKPHQNPFSPSAMRSPTSHRHHRQ